MNKDKYVFASLAGFLDNNKFRHLVDKYQGDRYIKSFTCWNQLLTMMFGQLCNRDGLRDLIVALEAHHGKLYHLGMGKSVTRSNLSKANENRDCRIFEEFAFYMIDVARKKRATKIFDLDGRVYAFDSTTIDLCLEVFWWAKFRKHKGGVKMHTAPVVQYVRPEIIGIVLGSMVMALIGGEFKAKGGSDEVFTVSRRAAADDGELCAGFSTLLEQLLETCVHGCDGIAAVGAIVGEEQAVLLVE